MSKESEIWKPAFGLHDCVEVSDLGNMRLSGTKIPLRIFGTKRTYSKFKLTHVVYKGTNLVHRIVALTFIPNPENKPVVNHLNGIKSDPRASNLEWATYSENSQHAHDMGLVNSKWANKSSLCPKKVKSIMKTMKMSQGDLAKLIGCKITSLRNALCQNVFSYKMEHEIKRVLQILQK